MVKHGSRRHRMKRGGGTGSDSRPHGASDIDMGDLHQITSPTGEIDFKIEGQSGGRRSRKHKHTANCRHNKKSRKTRKGRKYGGDGVVATAMLPFGLFGLQKYFQRNRTAKKNVKGLGNKVKSGFKSIRKML